MRYFDYNATTPLCDAAKRAWIDASEVAWQNPSSPYRAAASVRARLERSREQLGALLELDPSRIVFNSGATEGNNAVFCHLKETLSSTQRIALSPIEHPSVLEPAKAYFGGRIKWMPVDSSGSVQFQNFDFSEVSFVSLMAANNETGVLQPWREVAEICATLGVPFHCDASQWLGKQSGVGLSDCTYVTGCGHKFGAPKGVGFLVLPSEGALRGGMIGGSQEGGCRAGTEDHASVAALVAALAGVSEELEVVARGGKQVFLNQLAEAIPEARAIGAQESALWNTVMLGLPEFASSRWIALLEKRGFLVSSGSACSTGKAGPSHVLAAMGVTTDVMRRAIRVSSGWGTSTDDWRALADALVEVYHELKVDSESSGSKVISI